MPWRIGVAMDVSQDLSDLGFAMRAAYRSLRTSVSLSIVFLAAISLASIS